jgi:hypothetical protein
MGKLKNHEGKRKEGKERVGDLGVAGSTIAKLNFG